MISPVSFGFNASSLMSYASCTVPLDQQYRCAYVIMSMENEHDFSFVFRE